MNEGPLDIYRRAVLDHSRAPHNEGQLPSPTGEAKGFNPLCGDKLTIYVAIAAGTVTELSFEGNGCAISIASASMMTDALSGTSVSDAHELINEFESMLNKGGQLSNPRLEELRALEGVRAYPSRIKCATLAWNAMDAALSGNTGQVSTE